ncbi:hypothetical protein BVY02_01085 [bacterium J17]|nr:hypothetical protein BVY02_01085 [bacterium J17]
MKLNNYSIVVVFGLTLAVAAPIQSASAGGCAPGDPCWEEPAAPADVVPAPDPEPMVIEEPAPAPAPEPEGELHLGLSAGVNVLYFDCEDTMVAPGVFLDVAHDDLPLNFRVGVEGGTGEIEQFRFNPDSRLQNDVDFNFVRIPFSLEYVQSVGEESAVHIGGGPDLFTVSRDISDTDVGMHLGARFVQGITDTLGISVEAGYLWAEANDKGEDIDLDSAYTGVHLNIDLM